MPEVNANSISVIATMRATPGREDDLEKVLRALAPEVLSEDGCTSFVVTTVRNVPGLFRILEGYANDAALLTHASSPHMAALRPRLSGLLAEKLSIEILDVVA